MKKKQNNRTKITSERKSQIGFEKEDLINHYKKQMFEKETVIQFIIFLRAYPSKLAFSRGCKITHSSRCILAKKKKTYLHKISIFICFHRLKLI